jgi:hypothetical protein
MHAVVQPIFEGLVVFAWCLMAGVVPNLETPGPTHAQVASKAAEDVMWDLSTTVAQPNTKGCLSRFSPELQEKLKPKVEEVFDSPKRHCLAFIYRLEPVQIGSHDATYKAKILTERIAETGYQHNIEYATVTISPSADLDAGKSSLSRATTQRKCDERSRDGRLRRSSPTTTARTEPPETSCVRKYTRDVTSHRPIQSHNISEFLCLSYT